MVARSVVLRPPMMPMGRRVQYLNLLTNVRVTFEILSTGSMLMRKRISTLTPTPYNGAQISVGRLVLDSIFLVGTSPLHATPRHAARASRGGLDTRTQHHRDSSGIHLCHWLVGWLVGGWVGLFDVSLSLSPSFVVELCRALCHFRSGLGRADVDGPCACAERCVDGMRSRCHDTASSERNPFIHSHRRCDKISPRLPD